MKKLSKLTINASKLMKNEDLVNLKGGQGIAVYKCYCTDGGDPCYISLSCGDPGPISYTPGCASGYQNCELYGTINCID